MNHANRGRGTNQEEWRPAAGFPDYEVSSLGRVRRKTAGGGSGQWPPGFVLSSFPGCYGYSRLDLWLNGKKKTVRVHRLVADAFLATPPGPVGVRRGQWQVNHLDGDKLNSEAGNLEWTTPAGNSRHAFDQGLTILPPVQARARGERVGTSKLTREQVLAIRARAARGERRAMLAKDYGCTTVTIGQVVRRETWAWLK